MWSLARHEYVARKERQAALSVVETTVLFCIVIQLVDLLDCASVLLR